MTYDYVRAVQEYVEQHLSEMITVHDIAEHVGLNPSYLNTHFRAQTGFSIKSFIHRLKTEEAKRLLRETTYPISEIGTMLGYFDQSHFSRVFREYTGTTPKQYRMR